jgi:Uma2 family endonuclease
MELDNHDNPHENQDMPSINHSYIQSRLILSFGDSDKFTSFTELSLDASQVDLSQFGLKAKDELVPDVCLYEGTHQFDPTNDALKRSEMPVLAIEIVSASQGIDSILSKFKAYFALGIKSCWMVVPTTKAVTVYANSKVFETFGTKNPEIIDTTLGIQLQTQKIWGK